MNLLAHCRHISLKTTSGFLSGSTRAAKRPSEDALAITRSYAWSRSSGPRNRVVRTPIKSAVQSKPQPKTNKYRVIQPIEVGYESPGSPSQIAASEVPLPGSLDAEEGLQKLLQNDTLVVVRQIEMMNLFMGFEQANRYALTDVLGNHVGYMAEEEKGFLGTFSRQIFRTHRSFRSVIMDKNGTPVLWIHRPFSWINSRIYVQRRITEHLDEKPVILGEAQQEWHPWRRRYDVFTGREGNFEQFARVDAPLLSWEFYLQNSKDENVASIRRDFAGFGREIFTDTGQYVLTFRPDPNAPSTLANPNGAASYRRLSLEERATILALSVGIDFDYFSRHSEGRGLSLFPMWGSWGGGE